MGKEKAEEIQDKQDEDVGISEEKEKVEEETIKSASTVEKEERRPKYEETEVKKEKKVEEKPKIAGKTAPTRAGPKPSILSRLSIFEQKEEGAKLERQASEKKASEIKESKPVKEITPVEKEIKPVEKQESVPSVAVSDKPVERPSDVVEIKNSYGGQTASGNVRNRLAMFEQRDDKAKQEASVLQGKKPIVGKKLVENKPESGNDTEVDKKAKEESDSKEREELEKKAKEESERKAKKEADKLAKEESERKP